MVGNSIAVSSLRLNLLCVRILLVAHKVTQREIAALSGVHPGTVSRVLKNSRRVRPETRVAVLEALSKRFGCEPLELCLPGLAAA